MMNFQNAMLSMYFTINTLPALQSNMCPWVYGHLDILIRSRMVLSWIFSFLLFDFLYLQG